jgi:long-chain acyl-CoA synthetase
MYTINAVASLDALSEQDLHHFWLPLAHSFGLLMLFLQVKLGFASAVDGRLDGLTAKLKQVQPTLVCAVPRLLEKAQAQILKRVSEQPLPSRAVAEWSLRVAERRARTRQGDRPVRPSDPAYRLADRLVLSKLRAEFGGRVRFFLCGGAALNTDVAYFFEGIGIPALEGYGATEAGAGSFVNRPDAMRVGTVGLPLPGTQIRFADDGEILIKSPGMMRRYWKNPELTAQAFTEDGWLRMGDIGRLDRDGFLVITDRKKDLIKTAGGKYVAPQYLEARLKSLCPLLGHVVVHGDGRKFCCALMTLELDIARSWARARGIAGEDYASLAGDARVRAEIAGAVAALNTQVASYEAIRAFDILDEPLSLDAGELTPNAKLRRRAVETRHRARFDALYDDHGAMNGEPSEADIARFIDHVKTAAVVGLGATVLRESYRVSAALKLYGFRIIPVHPTATRVLGEKAYRTLAEIPFPVDVAVVFRRSEFAAGHIEEAIASGIPAVWLQEGVVDHAATRHARARGLFVVEDRCLLKTYRRLRRSRR